MSGILNSEACFDFYKKMAAKYRFWEIGIRDFLRDPKKYTFGKSNFKTFYKNQISQILPPFLSTSNTWMSSGFVENGIGRWRSKKIFLRSDPSGPRSTYTTNQTISILICSRIDDNLLCKFSQNVLQKDVLREIDVYDFVVVGPSALWRSGLRPFGGRAFGPSRSGARSATRLQRNTYKSTYSRYPKMAAKFGFSVIGKREFLRDPKKYTFGKSNFKTFYKNRKTQILPPFLSTSNSWMDPYIVVFCMVLCSR